MDCSIVGSKKYKDMFVVSTTDFFYPLVEDPYVQGQIAAANVLSDMYALGVVDVDNVLMILAASRDMPEDQRRIVTKSMMKGFNDQTEKAGSKVTGGQTVLNPWPIIGGVAKSICMENDIIRPENAVPNEDVVILTKPLGTQLAVNCKEWTNNEEKWAEVQDVITKEEVERAYKVAMLSMARLNRTGARLMHKYKAHGGTDVTGFGIKGHAQNLAENQKAKVEIRLHSLPIIKDMTKVAERHPFFKLLQGFSSETSGGLMVILPKENAQPFCDEIRDIDGWPAWIIGDVLPCEGESKATIPDDVKIIPV